MHGAVAGIRKWILKKNKKSGSLYIIQHLPDFLYRG